MISWFRIGTEADISGIRQQTHLLTCRPKLPAMLASPDASRGLEMTDQQFKDIRRHLRIVIALLAVAVVILAFIALNPPEIP
jgi:beta-lactamase regulating signal transducer with metallopeptidase domain